MIWWLLKVSVSATAIDAQGICVCKFQKTLKTQDLTCTANTSPQKTINDVSALHMYHMTMYNITIR